jgi:DNA-binding CsgD family transcriptional regulator
MRTGRPKKPLQIAAEERDKLRMIALRPKSAQAMAMRARIVLHCGEGMTNSEVARKLHITGATVGKWRERFRQLGLDGLLDEPREIGKPSLIMPTAGRNSSSNMGLSRWPLATMRTSPVRT